MRVLTIPLLTTLLLADLASQGTPWNIPHRGAIVYSRTTEKFELSPPPGRLRLEWVLPTAADGGHDWRYLACQKAEVPANFAAPSFDDSNWLIGRSEFGNQAEGTRRTAWTTPVLCLRTRLDLGRRKPRAVLLRVDHDDGLRVYCNGVEVLANDSFGRGREYVLTGEQAEAFSGRECTVAVRCDNIGGAQYLDFAMAALRTLPPGVRTGEELQQELRAARDAANRVRGDLFGGLRPPPMLLQGELDERREHVTMSPADLREIAWWVATDLQKGVTGGAWNLDLARMYRIGDLRLKCRADGVDETGWQRLEVQIESAEPALRGEDKRYVRAFVLPHVLYGFEGELTIRRRIETDGSRARVTEFHTELHARVLDKNDRKVVRANLDQVERWKFAAVYDGQDAAFRKLVHETLTTATESLRKRLENTNEQLLRAEPADGDRSYHSGRLAIGLLALVKGGVPKSDPVVEKGFDELRKRHLIDTYSLGNALMAMEALYAPPGEFADLKQGLIDRPRKRDLPDGDMQLVRRWTDQLLENIDTRVDRGYLLRFNYVAGGRYDHSVNQYGLLGLYAAHNCGVDISASLWEAAANHLMDDVGERGERMQLELTDYRTLARMQQDPEATVTVSRLPVRPMGWNYTAAQHNGMTAPFWGAMTCAGIAGLAICQAALLQNPEVKRSRLQSHANEVRNAAFGWLAQNLTVRYHPGWIQRQQAHFYYYLYGLERAALLSGIALIHDRDWYFEGSMMLGLTQQADGQWPGEMHADQAIERDAMAILFLKQSTLPVLTGQ